MFLQGRQAPDRWKPFKKEVLTELVTQDSIRWACDELFRLAKVKTMESYMTESGKLVIEIPEMSEDVQLDECLSGLKPQIRLGVIKACPITLEKAYKLR